MELPELDESAFRELREHLEISTCGVFGIAKRVGQPPSLSKRSWVDPYMYHLLILFARQYITIPFTSIWIDSNQCKIPKHIGPMYVVGFGKGDCTILIGDVAHNIKHRPLLLDERLRTIRSMPSSDHRYFLCAFVLPPSGKAGEAQVATLPSALNDYEAVFRGGKYVIACHKDGEPTEFVSKTEPLWKNAPRVKKLISFEDSFVANSSFNPAQNLLLRAIQEVESSTDVQDEEEIDNTLF